MSEAGRSNPQMKPQMPPMGPPGSPGRPGGPTGQPPGGFLMMGPPRPGRGPMMGGGPPGPPGMGAMLMPGQKAKDAKSALKRLSLYLKPYSVQIILIGVLAVIGTLFNTVTPKVMGLITTKIFDGMMSKAAAYVQNKTVPSLDFNYIGKIILLIIGLYIISAIFMYIQRYIMAGVSQKIGYDLRRDFYLKLSKLPLKYFDSQTHGEIMSRVTNDIDNISSSFEQSINTIITSVFTLSGTIIMMLWISPMLTLVTLVTLPVSFLFTSFIAKRSRKYVAAQQMELGMLNSHVEEMYTGHLMVKAFRHENKSIKKFNEVNDRLYDAGWKFQFVSRMVMPIMDFIGNIGYIIICVVGGVYSARNLITLGDVQAFIQYSRQFSMPITQVASIMTVFQTILACAERVFEVLDETDEIMEKKDPLSIKSPKGVVKFEHVSFRYKEEVPLIEDMNIQVKQGQMIAVVGPTGAGKTTLVNLLMRFYEINKGKIIVDGVDITDLRRGDLRSLFGMVLQDTWLFNGTIKDNIAYGREGATFDEIVTAAKAAHADHFIRALPDGYETILKDDATNISQGERQLVTIARAILANPAILILDEATSSVDTRTEVAIQQAMKKLMRDRTSFVIAHRLSTIRDAKLILVMKDGSIIETGNHAKLLAKGGFYADLYNSQFAGKSI